MYKASVDGNIAMHCNILNFEISHLTPTLLSNARDLSHDFINISITIIVVSIIIVPMSHISRIITFTSSQWPRCQDYYHLHQRQPCYRPGVQPMSSCDAGSPGPVFAVDHFLPPSIIIITLIVIWSNTVLPVHNMMVSLARRCHGRLRDGEASFLGPATLSTDKKSLFCQQHSLDLSK